MNKIFTIICCLCASVAGLAQELAKKDSVATATITKPITIFEQDKPLHDPTFYGRSQVITRQDIEAAPVQTIQGVITSAMGISSKSSGPMGSLTQLQARGGGFGGVIVLVNGKRVNSILNDIYTLDNIPFSLDMVERIEIRTGGDSKRWGEFATQGAVNIITRTKLSDSGAQLAVYGGNLNTLGGAATVGVDTKKSSTIINLSGDNQSDEDYKYSQAKTYVQSTYSIFKWVDAVVDASFVYNQYRAPFLFTNDSKEIENLNTYNMEGSFGFNYKLGKRLKLWSTYTYTHAKQQHDPFNLRDTPQDDPYAQYYLDKVQYTNYRNQVIDLGGSYTARMIELNFGFIHNSSKFQSSDLIGDQLENWLKVPGHKYNFYKYYGLRDSWNLYYNMTVKFKKWYINGGISVDSSPIYTKLTFAYGGELGYKFSDHFRGFFGYDSSFKNADFYQQYVLNDYMKGKDDLNNEKVSAFNFGIKYEKKYSKLSIMAYTQTTKEAIILKYNKSAGSFDYSNSSFNNLTHSGLELSYKIELEKATSGVVPITNLSVSYNYNNTNFKDSDSTAILTNNYMRHNIKGNLSARVLSKLYIDIDGNLQNRNGMFLASPDAQKYNDRWIALLNARIAWKAPDMRYQVYIQANNILNEKYYDVPYMPSQGATVMLGLKYNFLIKGKK